MWRSIGLQDFVLSWPEGRQLMMMDLAQIVSTFRGSTTQIRAIYCCVYTVSRWKRDAVWGRARVRIFLVLVQSTRKESRSCIRRRCISADMEKVCRSNG